MECKEPCTEAGHLVKKYRGIIMPDSLSSCPVWVLFKQWWSLTWQRTAEKIVIIMTVGNFMAAFLLDALDGGQQCVHGIVYQHGFLPSWCPFKHSTVQIAHWDFCSIRDICFSLFQGMLAKGYLIIQSLSPLLDTWKCVVYLAAIFQLFYT